MKFYKRFPGDIQIKTGHLTMAEFGAYDRLLDHYYATEAPLPSNRCYSIARALTKADRDAVDRVLAEFFTLTGAGWSQRRADEVIAEAQPRIEAAKANGRKGGRPKTKPTGFQNGTQDESETADPAKASQSQSHTPVPNGTGDGADAAPPTPRAKRGTRLPDDWVLPKAWGQWALSEGYGEADIRDEAKKFRNYWVAKSGRDAAKLDWGATWQNWMLGSKAPRNAPGESRGTKWHETRGGAEKKAAELGLPKWDECTPFPVYVASIRKALAEAEATA